MSKKAILKIVVLYLKQAAINRKEKNKYPD